MAPEQLQPLAHWPVTGWVLAAGVLVAARLGRSAAEAQRFDLAHLQVFPHLLPLGNMQQNAAGPDPSHHLLILHLYEPAAMAVLSANPIDRLCSTCRVCHKV